MYICVFFYITKGCQINCFFHLFSISELTHEFLQILEKTPSRLKRIRNWRVKNHIIYQCDYL